MGSGSTKLVAAAGQSGALSRKPRTQEEWVWHAKLMPIVGGRSIGFPTGRISVYVTSPARYPFFLLGVASIVPGVYEGSEPSRPRKMNVPSRQNAMRSSDSRTSYKPCFPASRE